MDPAHPDHARPGVDRSAVRAAAAFALVGVAWILLSDLLVQSLVPDRWQHAAQSVKGIAFMLLAATLVLLLVRHYGRQWERAVATARLTEDALRGSESRYRSLVERVPCVVWLNEVDAADPNETHCIYIGPQLEELLGYTPREWMADDDLWLRVVHPDDHARVVAANDEADATGALSMEYRAIRRDGTVVWIHDEAVVIPGDESRPAYWQGVMVDITAQRVQDQALHELTESLRGIFLASPLAIVVLEPDGTVRHWNPAADRIFGWRSDEVVGGPLPFVPPDLSADFDQVRRRTLAGEALAGWETTGARKDGTRIEVSLSTAPLLDRNGRLTGFLWVIEDVTDRRRESEERRRAETALRGAEERYRSLVEGGPAVVYLRDPHAVPAHLTYVSPQVVDLFGYPVEAWSADPQFWVSATHPDDRDRIVKADSAAIERGAPFDMEYRMIAADGREVWVHDRATLVRGDDGAPLFRQGVVIDVTGRHRAEQERRSAIDRQLRLATRLELLHEIDRDVLSSASIGELAGRTLDLLRLLVPFDRASVAVLDEANGRFSYAAVRAVPEMVLDPDLQSHVPDAVARDLLSRDVLVADLDELEGETPYIAGARAMGIRSVVSVALRTEDEQVGVLILVSRLPGAFDEEAVDIAREVGAELAIAIAQTRLRDQLEERADELARVAEERRQLLHRIVRAQEEERERVALELHDGLGQVLTSISLFASDLQQDVPEGARGRVARVNELVQRAIADSRHLVWSLRPPELERLGLVPALRRLVDELSGSDLTVDLHEEIGDLRLPGDSEAVVYRVVQEAVNNAMKHAGGSAVSVVLRRRNGVLTTLVEDDGGGFDPDAVPAGRGLGLIGMRERAELVGGDLVVESARESGTRVRLEVPVEAGG